LFKVSSISSSSDSAGISNRCCVLENSAFQNELINTWLNIAHMIRAVHNKYNIISSNYYNNLPDLSGGSTVTRLYAEGLVTTGCGSFCFCGCGCGCVGSSSSSSSS